MLELELAGISFHAGKNFGWLEADLRPENAADPVFRALRPRKPDRFMGRKTPDFSGADIFRRCYPGEKTSCPCFDAGSGFIRKNEHKPARHLHMHVHAVGNIGKAGSPGLNAQGLPAFPFIRHLKIEQHGAGQQMASRDPGPHSMGRSSGLVR